MSMSNVCVHGAVYNPPCCICTCCCVQSSLPHELTCEGAEHEVQQVQKSSDVAVAVVETCSAMVASAVQIVTQ